MSLIIVTAKTTDSVLQDLSLTTESRINEDTGDEEFRGIYRVIVQQDASNVSDVSDPTSELSLASELTVRFNQSSEITLLPLKDFDSGLRVNFRLVTQEYTPIAQKGSTFFRGVKEWVSVSEWSDLTWT